MPEDLYSPVDVDKDLLHDLLNAAGPKGPDPDVLYFDDLVAARICRNKTLSRPLSEFHNVISLVAVALTLQTLLDMDGNVPKQFIREWFGEQRLPQGWPRPRTPIGLWNTAQIVKIVRNRVEKKGV